MGGIAMSKDRCVRTSLGVAYALSIIDAKRHGRLLPSRTNSISQKAKCEPIAMSD